MPIRRPIFVVLISCLTVTPVLCAAPPEVWEFRGGAWAQVRAATTGPTTAATEPTLDRIDALLDAGRHREARKLALQWEKANKSSPSRDRVLFQIARAYYQYGDRLRAFFHLDELMDTYPESRLFYPALQVQYDIAEGYLNGYRRRVFKLPVIDADDDAIEILYRIQQRSPGSPLAERAMLRTADYYFAKGNYDLAGDAYTAYARGYPRSPAVPRARLRAAYASLAQFRGLLYDETPLIDARTQLESIVNEYPQMAADENLRELIARIDTTFARKSYVTADFYRRTNALGGATYTYRYVTDTYPDTPEAEEAADALRWMPPKVLAESGPWMTAARTPTTAPAGGRP